jgi:cation diffusion facilitator family transporter
MSTHASALLLAALAYSFARRYAADPRFSFGTGKLGDLAGFASAIILAMIGLLIAYEAVDRLRHPVSIDYHEAIAIAVLGLVVNIASAWLLSGGGHGHGHHHDHGHEDHADGQAEPDEPHAFVARVGLDGAPATEGEIAFAEEGHHQTGTATNRDNNLRSALVHIVADALVSLLVIVGLGLGLSFGLTWMDPLVGVVGAVVIGIWAVSLVRDTGLVLLDSVPDRRMADTLRQTIEEDGDRLTDLHLWRLGPGHLGAIITVATDKRRDPAYYRQRLARFRDLSHLTIEVCPSSER